MRCAVSEQLTFQIINNSKLILRETGSVLDARLHDGFAVLVQPTMFALYDELGGDSSILPLENYAETDTTKLKPPLSYSARYSCLSSLNDVSTGCNSATQKQQISLSASSVYFTGSSISGDGFDTADADARIAANRSNVLDIFVKEAWAKRCAPRLRAHRTRTPHTARAHRTRVAHASRPHTSDRAALPTMPLPSRHGCVGILLPAPWIKLGLRRLACAL